MTVAPEIGSALFPGTGNLFLSPLHLSGRIVCRTFRAGLLALLVVFTQNQPAGAQARERPYFMPSVERERLHELILKEAWAKADHARLQKAASTGDGFAAAFLYALDGDPKDAAIAQQWLLGKYGKKAYWTVRAADRLNGDFFKGGQVGIPEVYYDTDLSGYLAFDWAIQRPRARSAQGD